MSQLSSKAMIVVLASSAWGASKSDWDLGVELASGKGAKEGSVKAVKQLLKPEHIANLRSAIYRAQKLHKALTLPWSDWGDRVLPTRLYETYKQKMDAAIDEIDLHKRDFAAKYGSLVEAAKDDLGEMFDPSDYPPPGKIGSMFGASYSISPVPDSSHFVADIGDAEADRIRKEMDRRNQARIDAAVAQLYERVQIAVSKLVERLGTDESGDFRRINKSALDNVRDVVEAVGSLNITEDKRLAKMAGEIEKSLGDVEIGELRFRSTNPAKVEATKERRDSLRAEMEGISKTYFGV